MLLTLLLTLLMLLLLMVTSVKLLLLLQLLLRLLRRLRLLLRLERLLPRLRKLLLRLRRLLLRLRRRLRWLPRLLLLLLLLLRLLRRLQLLLLLLLLRLLRLLLLLPYHPGLRNGNHCDYQAREYREPAHSRRHKECTQRVDRMDHETPMIMRHRPAMGDVVRDCAAVVDDMIDPPMYRVCDRPAMYVPVGGYEPHQTVPRRRHYTGEYPSRIRWPSREGPAKLRRLMASDEGRAHWRPRRNALDRRHRHRRRWGDEGRPPLRDGSGDGVRGWLDAAVEYAGHGRHRGHP
jgi:hypothetical protein